MAYSAAVIIALASQCAPNVAPQTVLAIVQTESRGHPFALNVNGGSQPRAQTSATSAAATAKRYIAAGYSVDLGLGQINSRNMRKLDLTWDTVFDPCTNIAALGRVLGANYDAALPGREPQTALRVALSLYNAGSPSRGFRNGYVRRVVGNASVADLSVRAPNQLANEPPNARSSIIARIATRSNRVASPIPSPPAWNLFERAAYIRRSALPADPVRRMSVWSD